MGALSARPQLGRHLTIALAGGLIIGIIVWGVLWAIDSTSYDIWGGLVVGPFLLLATLPLARRAAKHENDPRLAYLIIAALILKFVASCVRYYVAFVVYDGSADAGVYIREGGWFAENLRQGMILYEPERGGGSGTHFIRQLTGWVFFFTGTSRIGGFFVFSWFGFLGQYLAYRAFRIAVPHGLHRRYALLVFLMPTLLYWPASIGKDAWMLLTIGLGAYGAARILTHRPSGYAIFALSLVGSAAVRPHVTALLAAALAASFLLRRSPEGSIFTLVAKIVGTVLVLGGTIFAIQAAEERFGVPGEGVEGAAQVIEETAEQTRGGGSEYTPTNPRSIVDVPRAVFTVLFRPLPHEAHNAQALITSMEGMFLLALFAFSWQRLRRLPLEAWQTPYVMFASAYSLMFTIAFASIGNFGILARQRSQGFLLLLVILALPTLKEIAAIRESSERKMGQQAVTGRVLIPVPAEPEASRGRSTDAAMLDPGPLAGQGTELVIDLPDGSTRPPGEPD